MAGRCSRTLWTSVRSITVYSEALRQPSVLARKVAPLLAAAQTVLKQHAVMRAPCPLPLAPARRCTCRLPTRAAARLESLTGGCWQVRQGGSCLLLALLSAGQVGHLFCSCCSKPLLVIAGTNALSWQSVVLRSVACRPAQVHSCVAEAADAAGICGAGAIASAAPLLCCAACKHPLVACRTYPNCPACTLLTPAPAGYEEQKRQIEEMVLLTLSYPEVGTQQP